MGRGARSDSSAMAARPQTGMRAVQGPLRHTTFPNYARPLDHFLRRQRRDGDEIFDLDPPYQRGHVWTSDQQVNLIRSLLEGVPIAGIYINDRGDFVSRVLDGKQRVTAIRAFADDKLPVPRTWFADDQLQAGAVGKDRVVFSDLDLGQQRRFGMGLTVLTYETSFSTVADEAEIFELLNTAGVPHGPDAQREAQAAHMVSDAPLQRMHLDPFNFSVQHFVDPRMDGEDKFDLDAPYQRSLVWDDERRVNLIRSLLLGVPQGAVVVNDRGDLGKFVVIDGKQRVSTYRAFVADEFAVPRAWFEDKLVDGAAHGKNTVTFSDLSETGRRKLLMSAQPAYQSQFKTVAEEHEVFNRLNFAGCRLSLPSS